MTDFDIRYTGLRRAIIEQEFEKLNDMQRKAVFKTQGPLLLLAGAGSGKTTVLINRIINLLRFGAGWESEEAPHWAGEEHIARLLEEISEPGSVPETELLRLCGVDAPKPWEIIAITFTNKAAGELRERLEIACGDAGKDIWAHTFHTACTRILRRNIEKLGYSKDFTIYDEDDKKKLLVSVIRDCGFDEKKFDPRGVIREISRAKDELLNPEDYAYQVGEDYYRKTVARFYAEYQKRMRAANALDFDDIIFRTVELLQDFAEVRAYYQQKFRYVLVDEYQDTNHAQYVLCSLLAGGWNNLCVVGDDDQSIYKFRGATIANILEFEEQYPNAVTIRLEQNYRSTENILNAANHVIAQNTARKGKTLWTENGTGSKVKLYQGETQEEEAKYIAKAIETGYAKGEKLKDFTVLYRNHALSNSIEAAFQQYGIPYRVVSGLRFFDRAEVKDMLAYLWVINNPADTLRLQRIINTPARKIGAKAQETLQELAQRESASVFGIAENAKQYPELSRSADAVASFAAMMNDLISRKFDTPLPDFYDLVMEKTGYLADLQRQNNEEANGRIDNIMELKSNIADYCQRTENPSLSGFLEEVSLITDVDRYDAEADAVTMMTMHSAKGLEFPTVFLCGCEEGLFPSFRSMESEEEIEEERRICYVAMTRAKRELHITCAKRRMLYGQTSYAKPSRFIGEVPAELIEDIGAQQRQQAAARREAAYNNSYASRNTAERMVPRPSVSRPAKVSAASGSSASFSNATYHKGQKVIHKAWGNGVIQETTPMGGDMLLQIEFEKVGSKMMMAKTAGQFIKVI